MRPAHPAWRPYGPEKSSRIVDYLVKIDHGDDFAWAVSTFDGRRGVAEARYIPLPNDDEAAEIAFDVLDYYQGRGLGILLLGALAMAASNVGIARFVAEVLYDNRPMLGVLDEAGATRRHLEPGVVACSLDGSEAKADRRSPPVGAGTDDSSGSHRGRTRRPHARTTAR